MAEIHGDICLPASPAALITVTSAIAAGTDEHGCIYVKIDFRVSQLDAALAVSGAAGITIIFDGSAAHRDSAPASAMVTIRRF